MPYRHPAARIYEIVKAPKALVVGQSVVPKKRGSHGLSFEVLVGSGRLAGVNPLSSVKACGYFQLPCCEINEMIRDLLSFGT